MPDTDVRKIRDLIYYEYPKIPVRGALHTPSSLHSVRLKTRGAFSLGLPS